MNKLHRQGKAIFASIWVRLLFILSVFIFTTIVLNLLINIFHFIQYQANIAKQYGFSAMNQQVDFVKNYWTKFFEFPKLKFSGEGVLFPEILYYVVVYTIVGLLSWRRVYDIKRSYENINKGSKGTARWTTEEEMLQQYKKIPLKGRYEGESGVPVQSIPNEEAIFIDTMNTNSRAVAETQSGKTQTFSYPLIDIVSRAMVQDSMVINDIKGNMFRGTRDDLIDLGYIVKCFNLLMPELSMQYNPLFQIQKEYFEGNISRAEKLTKSFSFKTYHNKEAKDPVWQEGAQAVVSATILTICRIAKETNQPKLVNIPAVFNFIQILGELDEQGNYLMDRYFAQLPLMSPENKQYTIFKKSEIKQRSSFMISVLGKLQAYLDTSVAELIVENDFDFTELGFGEKPVALFVIFPDSDDSDYQLLSLFYNNIFTTLAQAATKTRSGKLPRRVRVIMEEAMNIPAIEGLVRGLNVNLERNIVVHFVYQSEGQADETYGKEQAIALRNACGNNFFIMSQDWDDTEGFIKRLGQSTIITYNRAGDFLDLDKSYTEMEDGRLLMFADEAMRLREGEWILMRTKHRRDNKGNPITPYPIRANIDEGTQMRFAYKYLPKYFKNDQSLEEIGSQRKLIKEVNIEDYIFKPGFLEHKIMVDEIKKSIETTDERAAEVKKYIESKKQEEIKVLDKKEREIMAESIESTAEVTEYEARSIYEAWSDEKREAVFTEAECILTDEEYTTLRQFKLVENYEHFYQVNKRREKLNHLFSLIFDQSINQ